MWKEEKRSLEIRCVVDVFIEDFLMWEVLRVDFFSKDYINYV